MCQGRARRRRPGTETALNRFAWNLALSLGAALLLAAVGAPLCAQAPAVTGGVTTFRVTGEVVLPHVTRLGINLGEQNYYDSGQMLKNLLFRNPGFEAMAFRSVLHCNTAAADLCQDHRSGLTWPAGFWDDARFEVLDGLDAGRTGRVVESGPIAGGYAVTLDAKGRQAGAGDWIAVSKDFPGDPAAGWWPSLQGGAQLKAERADLSPATQGRQALRIEAAGPAQSAQLKSYFDTTEGRTFLRLKGRYRISFRAKFLTGFKILRVSVRRIAPGARAYLDQDVLLKPQWTDYPLDFAANEGPAPVGPVEVSFSTAGGALLLDDVSLERTDGDPANRTAFRDEVVQTLKELRPGVLRLISGHSGLGSTIDNLIAPVGARVRPGYLGWTSTQEDIPVGFPEFLALCREVGAEPWLVIPLAMNRAEARRLAEYLTGSASTEGGAVRASEGQAEPWSRVFPTIHLELGNETWNGIYTGATMDSALAYGRRAGVIFSTLRAAAGADAARLDLVVGAQVVTPGRNHEILEGVREANSLAIAPYLMHSVTQWATDDELFGPLMAEPEEMSRGGVVAASRASAAGRQLAVYEVNLHTTDGTT
ncbi:MAG: hypothetical protein WCE75_00590, partial [Terracidiphilus sp.]